MLNNLSSKHPTPKNKRRKHINQLATQMLQSSMQTPPLKQIPEKDGYQGNPTDRKSIEDLHPGLRLQAFRQRDRTHSVLSSSCHVIATQTPKRPNTQRPTPNAREPTWKANWAINLITTPIPNSAMTSAKQRNQSSRKGWHGLGPKTSSLPSTTVDDVPARVPRDLGVGW